MKQQVDNLIANTLLDEGEVYLPQVGTLILYRHSAKLLSSTELQRPYRELRLTREERGESITTFIATRIGYIHRVARTVATQRYFNNRRSVHCRKWQGRYRQNF